MYTIRGKEKVKLGSNEKIQAIFNNGEIDVTLTSEKFSFDEIILYQYITKDGLLHCESEEAYKVASIEENTELVQNYKNIVKSFYLNGIHLTKKEYDAIINNKYYILEKDNYKYYFMGRRLHRLDGPAIEGEESGYWINGQEVSEEEFKSLKWSQEKVLDRNEVWARNRPKIDYIKDIEAEIK